MSNFECLIYKIKEPVIDHPNADRLSLIQIEGYTCISAKLDDGSHRYKQGDLVVYIPESAVMAEWMLKEMDFWDVNKNKPAFRYVKAKKLRGIFSQGILYPVENLDNMESDDDSYWIKAITLESMHNENIGLNIDIGDPIWLEVKEGEDVKDFLGITKWEPVVPASMRGTYTGEYIQHTMKYDFDSIQKHMDMFAEGEHVFVTEKIHGSLMEIGYIPELNDENLFNNNIFVTSKGIAKQGFIYKNLESNADNLWVKMIKKILEETSLATILQMFYPNNENVIMSYAVKSIHIFGEVFGQGIQDLGYGSKIPQFRVFDIAINKEFVSSTQLKFLTTLLHLDMVPILYEGPFSMEKMIELRDGKDTISGSHIREGIVIKSDEPSTSMKYSRKIAKFVSPDYLLRANGSEFE